METIASQGAAITGALVPPSGGSLEIGNKSWVLVGEVRLPQVPPSGGSLEIGNCSGDSRVPRGQWRAVPPSGGSLEIGNRVYTEPINKEVEFPLRGDP